VEIAAIVSGKEDLAKELQSLMTVISRCPELLGESTRSRAGRIEL
jgi:hypothetical protein